MSLCHSSWETESDPHCHKEHKVKVNENRRNYSSENIGEYLKDIEYSLMSHVFIYFLASASKRI